VVEQCGLVAENIADLAELHGGVLSAVVQRAQAHRPRERKRFVRGMACGHDLTLRITCKLACSLR
jgi:hypothetical protein